MQPSLFANDRLGAGPRPGPAHPRPERLSQWERDDALMVGLLVWDARSGRYRWVAKTEPL